MVHEVPQLTCVVCVGLEVDVIVPPAPDESGSCAFETVRRRAAPAAWAAGATLASTPTTRPKVRTTCSTPRRFTPRC